jgi:hypothetical protein
LLGATQDGFVGAKLFPLSNTEGFPKLPAPDDPGEVLKIEGVLFSFEGLPKEEEVFAEMKGTCPKVTGFKELLWPSNADKAEPGKAFNDSSILPDKPPSEPSKLFAEDVCGAAALLEDFESCSNPSSSPSETNRESVLDDAGVN